MDKTKWFKIVLKTITYFITLVLGALGMSLTCSSCTTSRNFNSSGTGSIIVSDTTFIHHDTGFSYSRNGFKFK